MKWHNDTTVMHRQESSGCHGPFTYIDDVLWKFLLKIPKSDTNHLDRKSWGAVLCWLLLAMSTIKKSWYILLLGKMLCVTFCFAGEIILKFFFILYFIFIATRIMREKEICDFHNFFSFVYVYFFNYYYSYKNVKVEIVSWKAQWTFQCD